MRSDPYITIPTCQLSQLTRGKNIRENFKPTIRQVERLIVVFSKLTEHAFPPALQWCKMCEASVVAQVYLQLQM